MTDNHALMGDVTIVLVVLDIKMEMSGFVNQCWPKICGLLHFSGKKICGLLQYLKKKICGLRQKLLFFNDFQ